VAADKFWNFGAGAGNWDMLTTQNWRATNTAGASDSTFGLNDRATFGDLGLAGARTVNVAVAGVTPGEVDIINSVGNDYTIQGGPILGAGNLIKSGAGTATLSGANQFSGLVSVKNGTLNVSTIGDSTGAGNLGMGSLIVLGDATGTTNAVLNY